MKKMYEKVLVVSNMFPNKEFPSYGIFVKNFCDQLSELGIRYDVSALTKTKNRIIKLFKYGQFYIGTFFRCLFGGYDLTYIHYPSFSAKPVLIARKLRKFDIISNVHGTDVVPLKPEHQAMLGNTRKAFTYSRKIVVPSEYYKQLIIEKYKVEPRRVFVYPSAGVNDSIFFEYDMKKKEMLKKEYGIDENTFVIGFVSRINKAKGWDVFIDALEILEVPKNRKVKVFIVGSGEDDEALERRINSCSKELREVIVRFPLVEQNKLAEIYNLLDVFIFPTMSASESLGLVAIEAMSCGCPVIASNYAAPKYYVVDGKNGYKFNKGNSLELKETIDTYALFPKDKIASLKEGALQTSKMYTRKEIEQVLNGLFSI